MKYEVTFASTLTVDEDQIDDARAKLESAAKAIDDAATVEEAGRSEVDSDDADPTGSVSAAGTVGGASVAGDAQTP
jgi:hypothetical protein